MLTPITQEPKAYNVDIGPLKPRTARMELMSMTVRVPGSRIECRMYIRIPIRGRGPALNLCWGYGSRIRQ